MLIDELKSDFIERFGESTESLLSCFAPGRVNLIGEHTDYNGGFVFPCALDFGTYLIFRKNKSNSLRLASTNFDFTTEIDLSGKFNKVGDEWVNYPLGVVDQLQKSGMRITGGDFLFSGDIPNGAGLSSSASIEVVTAFALNSAFQLDIELIDLVKISQKAENEFVGVNCGIMDQFSVAFGKKDHAIFLDCDTLEYKLVPVIMDGFRLVISNTNKRRGLADSKYNERRSECDEAVRYINAVKPIKLLGELTMEQFQQVKSSIENETVFRRTRHVVTEIDRVKLAVSELKAGNLQTFGKLMNESHNSLRDDYEVTGFELDTLVDEARKVEGVLGSRMTGAGFGGCTVSLVDENAIPVFKSQVGKKYKEKTGLEADFYVASIGDGVKKL